jgi:hypothetical protein
MVETATLTSFIKLSDLYDFFGRFSAVDITFITPLIILAPVPSTPARSYR